MRAGRNTLAPYDENPPDLTVAEDDVVFLDLGPVFEEWEADFGRTFVVGNDPLKHKLRRDIEDGFAKGSSTFTTIRTSRALNSTGTHANSERIRMGVRRPYRGTSDWCIPHEKISGDKITLYVHPKNPNRMKTLDALGRKRHWIFEIHFVDRARQIGGFYEELLTI